MNQVGSSHAFGTFGPISPGSWHIAQPLQPAQELDPEIKTVHFSYQDFSTERQNELSLFSTEDWSFHSNRQNHFSRNIYPSFWTETQSPLPHLSNLKIDRQVISHQHTEVTNTFMEGALQSLQDKKVEKVNTQNKANFGTHAVVAFFTSAVVASNWWVLFEFINRPDTSSLSLLLATIPLNSIFLNIFGKFVHEFWEIPIYQKTIRPKISSIINKLKLSAVFPAFRKSNGLPSYFRDEKSIMMRMILFEDEIIQTENVIQKHLIDSDIQTLSDEDQHILKLLEDYKNQDEAYLMDLLKQIQSLKIELEGFELAKEEEKPQMFASLLKKKNQVNPHLYTAVGSALLAMGAMAMVYGVPDFGASMANTKSIFTYALINAFGVKMIQAWINETINIPPFEYLFRPFMVKSKNQMNLENLTPSMDGILGLPPRELWRFGFDSLYRMLRKVFLRRKLELNELSRKAELSEYEIERKEELIYITTKMAVVINEIEEEIGKINTNA